MESTVRTPKLPRTTKSTKAAVIPRKNKAATGLLHLSPLKHYLTAVYHHSNK